MSARPASPRPTRARVHRAVLALVFAALAPPAAAAPASVLEVVFGPHETSQLELKQLNVFLDGAALPVELPAPDAESAQLYAGVVKPGAHKIAVEAAFTGKSSVFSYVDGYVFRMKGDVDAEAPAGQALRVDVKVVRVSGITVAWTDRHRLSLRAGTHPSDRAAASELPDGSEAAAPAAAAPEPAVAAAGAEPRIEPAAAVVPAVHVESAPVCTLDAPPRFATGKHELDAAARDALDRFAECLGRNADAVEIEGGADPTGSAGFNAWLSEMRAREVADHLARRGVARSRLTVHALGATRLVCSEATRDCYARNRRAEAVSVRR